MSAEMLRAPAEIKYAEALNRGMADAYWPGGNAVGGVRLPHVEAPRGRHLTHNGPVWATLTPDGATLIVGESMGVDVSISVDPPAELWRLPIETVSQSERGFERAYQGTSLVFSWPCRDQLDASIGVDVAS